jgi:hypothetical protein
MTRVVSSVLAAALACALTTEAQAQPYAIDWSTIDGGGGTVQGGSYTLSGTIGQPDASAPLVGPTYTLTGGFWPGVGAVSMACNPADLAEPFGTLDLADISMFVTAFQALEPAADLAPPFGTFDLADISVFVTAFLAGCP